MHNRIRAVVAATAFTAIFCSAGPVLARGFIEGSVGIGIPETVSTKTYTFTDTSVSPANTYSGKITGDYGDNITAGVEIGAVPVPNGPFWWSLSYDYFKASIDSATVSGTQNGVSGSYKFTSAQLRAAGINADNDVHLAGGNVYFSPSILHGRVRPYAGVGVGAAFISHAKDPELALSVTGGVRTFLTERTYVGLRYRWYHIAGPTDDLGVEYKPIHAHLISAVVGMYFW